METYELRYFCTVARCENIHGASKQLSVSPASLSKAISRLEAELGVNLFSHVGRNIRLTGEGRLLLTRASEILSLEEATRIELQGKGSELQVRMAGPECLLAHIAPHIVRSIQKTIPQAKFLFRTADEIETERLVQQREVHMGVTTSEVPQNFSKRKLLDCTFETVVGREHPLFKAAKSGKVFSIKDVLRYPFVKPEQLILGVTGKSQSTDGWRDDKFPRKIGFLADSLQAVEGLLLDGVAIAYLPNYYTSRLPVQVLKIDDCPYSCKQSVKLVCRDSKETAWLSSLF